MVLCLGTTEVLTDRDVAKTRCSEYVTELKSQWDNYNPVLVFYFTRIYFPLASKIWTQKVSLLFLLDATT
jgi:hypothetical protein